MRHGIPIIFKAAFLCLALPAMLAAPDREFCVNSLNDSQVIEIRQSDFSCGPACLRYLVTALGGSQAVTSIPSPVCPRPHGWTFSDLRISATLLGLSATAEICDQQHLSRRLGTTAHAGILHVDTRHYVLIFRRPDHSIRVFDPAGDGELSFDEFQNRFTWSGATLFLTRHERAGDSICFKGELL